MDAAHIVDLLEDVRERHDRGEVVDLDAYRQETGEHWTAFRELAAFDEAFGRALEPDTAGGTGELPSRFGEYVLLREVGRGGIGVVYEAHHERLDRRVAIKTLLPQFEADQTFRRRYEREARSCAQVRHPHLVEIYESGDVDGRLYYAMPLLTGAPLSDAIRDARVPAAPELFRQIAGVADAVAALHAARIVHRDIKPANILVQDDGRFVLADFGLARRIDLPAMTQVGQHVGTPQYMSPEQLSGTTNVDARTDVYALGATLYEALSGRGPFRADSFEALGRKILSERAPALDAVVPGLPPTMSQVVMRCLERRPDDRYATAGDLASDLRAAAAGETVHARSPSRFSRWRRALSPRHVGLVIGVVALVGAALAFTRPGGDRPPATTRVVFRTDDLEALMRQARDHGITEITIEVLPNERATEEIDPVQLLFPRGAVRAEDLDSLRIDVTEAFEGEGELVFSQRSAVLARVPFVADEYANRLALPLAVRRAARPGAEITWAFVAPGGVRAEASFHVVAPDLAPPLGRIEQLAETADPAATLLRALVLLDHGLGVAAYRTLAPLRADAPTDDSAPAVRLQAEALRRAFGDAQADLERTDAWHALGLRLEDLAR